MAVFEERNKDEICRELGIDRDYLRVLAAPCQEPVSGEVCGDCPGDVMTHSEADSDLGRRSGIMLDELSSSNRHAFEEHYFDCADCAEDVRTGAMMREGVTAGLLGRTNVQVDQLRAQDVAFVVAIPTTGRCSSVGSCRRCLRSSPAIKRFGRARCRPRFRRRLLRRLRSGPTAGVPSRSSHYPPRDRL